MGFKPKQKYAERKTTYPIFQAGLLQPQAERYSLRHWCPHPYRNRNDCT